VLDCSLMTSEPSPSGSGTVWFGDPETGMKMLLILRFRRMELPETANGQLAEALDSSTSAVMTWPATVRFAAAAVALDWLWSPEPLVVAERACAVRRPGMFVFARP